jgi:hypothetical protein
MTFIITYYCAGTKWYLEEDLLNPNFAGVWMPDALARKYQKANKTLAWQYVFPSP